MAATAAEQPIVLTGVIMGGGPCQWAARDHALAGLPVYATPDAARTFNDDLEAVQREMGVRIVGDEEAARLEGAHISLRDLYLDEVMAALAHFDVQGGASGYPFDALAVAVFDHGNAPPDVSDRVFRFDYLARRFSTGRGLLALGFRREQTPAEMTRLLAVAACAPPDLPLLLMDTAPAAVLGALDDPRLAQHNNLIVATVGNFHCLAFHLAGGQIAGCFEHHTGELTAPQLVALLERLGQGSITNQEVFDSMGHGALVLQPTPGAQPFLALTGPRHGLLREEGIWNNRNGAALRPYIAVPHGAMMLAGCFGLLRAYAANYPEAAEAIERGLAQ
jgi:uncharacterized protein (DUF1786 family)